MQSAQVTHDESRVIAAMKNAQSINDRLQQVFDNDAKTASKVQQLELRVTQLSQQLTQLQSLVNAMQYQGGPTT